MKILVVNPPNTPFSSLGILIEPIDLLSAATYIASLGHEVSFLDMDVRRIHPAQFDDHAAGLAYDIVVILFDYHIPLHGDGALGAALEVAARAKALGARVAVGGEAATRSPEALLFHGTPVDVLLRGEAEPSLAALCALDAWTPSALGAIAGISFLGHGGAIESTRALAQPFDLSQLPIPDRKLAELGSYIDTRTLLSSRGCHMKCDFCHVPAFWGNWRARSASSVADEIEYLATELGAKKILFLDDNATVGRRRMMAICGQIAERGIRVAMGCLSSFDRFEPRLMEAMLKAGFRWIHYGAESGSDRLLRSVGKPSDSATIRHVLRETQAMGLRARTSWIMDLPTANSDDLARTADLILETRSHEIRLHYLALRMGSAMGKRLGRASSTQYIHQGSQNQNLCAASSDEVADSVETIVAELGRSGYASARHPDEFLDVGALSARCEDMRIVSLCPMRYGLNWEY